MDPIQQNPIPAPLQPAPKKSLGPVIGIIVIIILLIVGALYIWGSKMNTQSTSDTSMTDSQRMMAPQSATPVSKSDDVDSIDQDLKADAGTNVDFSSIETQ